MRRRRWYVWVILGLGTVIAAVTLAVTPTRRLVMLAGSAVLDHARYERIGTDSAASIVAATERAGAMYAAAAPGDSAQPGFPRPYEIGSPARRCIDVGDARGARSGEYWMNDFLFQYGFWLNGDGGFRYQPMFLRDARRDSVVVSFSRLDRRVPTEGFVITGARNGGGPAGRWFAENYKLPGSGLWLIVARGGPNWGCFIYRFPVFGPYWAPSQARRLLRPPREQ